MAAARPISIPPSTSAPTLERPMLSVVIVNYRQWTNTARLARLLRRSDVAQSGISETIVVDNGSPLRPAATQLRRTRGVRLYRSDRNRGFAAGVNAGVRLARGDWFLLLNPDTTVEPGFLDAVLAAAERYRRERPSVGVVGFRLRDPSGEPQGSCGVDQTFVNTLTRLVRPRARREYRRADAAGPVPWLTGCGLLIRRDCFEALAGFDPDYFLYYEDVDFARRARAAGWEVWFDPSIELTHHQPIHARAVSPRLRLLTRFGLLTYARKHWSRWSFRVLAAMVWAEARWRRRQSPVFRAQGRVAAEMFRGRAEAAGRLVRKVVRLFES